MWWPTTAYLPRRSLHNLSLGSHGGKLGLPWFTWTWTDYNPGFGRITIRSNPGRRVLKSKRRLSLYSHSGNSKHLT